MLQRSPFPCGKSRREFVWDMGAGFAGVALASLLGRDGVSVGTAAAEETPQPTRPRAKACIFLMMNGAPSQVDTFDFKPEL